MKDEIKEILDFKENADYKRLSYEEILLIKDYITDLQQKYERMKENAEILANGYNELEKRNEKAIDHIKENICYDEVVCSVCNILLNILQGSDNNG